MDEQERDDGLIRDWLLAMYNEEIVQEEGAIENEEEWVKGVPDEETRVLHESNASLHRQYLAVLRKRRDRIATEGV